MLRQIKEKIHISSSSMTLFTLIFQVPFSAGDAERDWGEGWHEIRTLERPGNVSAKAADPRAPQRRKEDSQTLTYKANLKRLHQLLKGHEEILEEKRMVPEA